jgi:hypothetical protein
LWGYVIDFSDIVAKQKLWMKWSIKFSALFCT